MPKPGTAAILLKERPLYGWQCPYCLRPVGYLGRFFAWALGVGFHGCDLRNVQGR